MKRYLSAIAVLVTGLWGWSVQAQTMFVQIEAHNTQIAALDRSAFFAARLPDVNGLQFGTGWYAVSLGPYTEPAAIARMQALKISGEIPPDSFLVQQGAYSAQFYPEGGAALSVPAGQSPSTETQTAALETTPTPAIEPEETRQEALRSERDLSRQEKFDLQIAMQWFGFYDGAIDAAFGPGTRNSMAAWQSAKSYDPTGVLTTRQRAELLSEYQTVLASLDLRQIRDETAGIEIQLPQAMVAFDRYDSPFAHYNPINDSGVTVLLISQTGDENTLFGLYDIMQTLEIVPLEGQRERRANRFTLTGENNRIKSYTHAVLNDDQIKGFTLIWPAGEDRRYEVALKAMRDSFTVIEDAVLPDAYGEGTLEQSIDLISGLQIRTAQSARSGFYVDDSGSVLTTASAVDGCVRITLDEIYEVEVAARDPALGLALLRPVDALAPLDFARFQPAVPRLKSEVAVSGYSFEGMLGAPTLTFGTLADLKGLRGEATIKRLALAASPGDAGGPVFDTSGSVLGMLLPEETGSGKRLPEGVSFATASAAIAEFLSNSGFSPVASDQTGAISTEELTRRATNLTVLVSCWDE